MWRYKNQSKGLLFSLLFMTFFGSSNAHALPPDPRALGPFLIAMTVIDEGCNYDLDGTSLIWNDSPFFGPTSFPVAFGDHDFVGSDTRCPGNPAVLVDMKARVFYPGTPGVVAAGGPFPLVVILHGQQIFSIPGYEGYDYLGTLLASHGFIVASIDGRSLLDSTIKSRGEHVREHIRRFVARNAPGSGSFLAGKIDLSKVTVIGHSRGGDSVVAAWEWQRVAPDPGYAITALVAIAPVQFFGRIGGEPSFISHMRDVHFQILHGSNDCDVSDFQGLRHYDRAADLRAVGDTLKSMVFIKDANHNFFNTVWETQEGDECGGAPQVLAAATARDILKAYVHSFLETVIKGSPDFRGYLTGEVANPVAGTTVALDFQAPGPDFLALDHFEELPGKKHKAGKNSLNGAVRKKQLTNYSESFLAATVLSPLASYRGETFAGYLLWGGKPDPRFSSQIQKKNPPDLTPFDFLSFRAGQVSRFGGGGINPPGNQDFNVQVTDASKNVALVKVSDFAALHSPFVAITGDTKTIMEVVRIPFSAFSGVDKNTIRKVEFLFNRVAVGEIVVDDLRFTK